jgi:hypothetical protein
MKKDSKNYKRQKHHKKERAWNLKNRKKKYPTRKWLPDKEI